MTTAERALALPTGREKKAASPPRRLFRSIIGKLVLLLLVFIAVPVMLYSEFRQADLEKQVLLLKSVREQGRLLAENLRPILERKDPSPLLALPGAVKRLTTPSIGIKVLFRPKGEIGAERFYFVATEPALPPTELEAERDRLIERGVLDSLVSSCVWEEPTALRYQRPNGGEELLTSISPITTDAGCWALVTTHSATVFLGTSLGQPYWKTLEVRIAAGIYLAMALLTIGVLVSIWRSLMRFRRIARGIRTGAQAGSSFEQQNQVPELALVAGEFDRMTRALQDTTDGIRRAAEDNAHAFKTPIAIMRQSLEPLRRIVPLDSKRGHRALDVLDESIDRLDHLVAAARHIEETTAELIETPKQDIDLSHLIARLLDAYADTFVGRSVSLETKVLPQVIVSATEELLDTVLENVIDNALSFSKPGSKITLELRTTKNHAELKVMDEGPGVPPPYLRRIFERYVSLRPKGEGTESPSFQSNRPVIEAEDHHPGIGLWIVRRNLEAVGGKVRAENRPAGGLTIIMLLPLAK